jgi:hypothetical protein
LSPELFRHFVSDPRRHCALTTSNSEMPLNTIMCANIYGPTIWTLDFYLFNILVVLWVFEKSQI